MGMKVKSVQEKALIELKGMLDEVRSFNERLQSWAKKYDSPALGEALVDTCGEVSEMFDLEEWIERLASTVGELEEEVL